MTVYRLAQLLVFSFFPKFFTNITLLQSGRDFCGLDFLFLFDQAKRKERNGYLFEVKRKRTTVLQIAIN